MNIPFYHVDAFTRSVFAGNYAGVCFLDSWPGDSLLQSIAAENNLPETAFLVESGEGYDLRWFTPSVEMDLCGHATLASAHVIFKHISPGLGKVDFATKSGMLSVERDGDLLVMDFPSRAPVPCPPPDGIADMLGVEPVETLSSRDLIVLVEMEKQVRNLTPDLSRIAALKWFAVSVTAPGDGCDFVSRFFAPGGGIPEDPVTGSVHCSLVPFWSARLGKKNLHARQVSSRGGELFCTDHGDRVAIGGHAAIYLTGTLAIPDELFPAG